MATGADEADEEGMVEMDDGLLDLLLWLFAVVVELALVALG